MSDLSNYNTKRPASQEKNVSQKDEQQEVRSKREQLKEKYSAARIEEAIVAPQICEDIAKHAAANGIADEWSIDRLRTIRDEMTYYQRKKMEEATGAKFTPKKPGPKKGSRHKATESQVLNALAMIGDVAEYYHVDRSDYYIGVMDEGVWKLLRIAGGTSHFTIWLRRNFRKEFEGILSPNNQELIVKELMSDIDEKGTAIELHTRIAHSPDREKIFLDLHNAQGEVVEISRDGWYVTTSRETGIFFRDAASMLALPRPNPTGTLADIYAAMPPSITENYNSRILSIAWLLGTLIPGEPYAHLHLIGESGAAKSFVATSLIALIDPNRAMQLEKFGEAKDFAVTAQNRAILHLDNLSRMSYHLSDRLCRLSTGLAVSSRFLYTTDLEFTIYFRRPVLFTGISNVVTRSDLVSRCIFLEIPAMDPGERMSETALLKSQQEHAAKALGALLNHAVLALRYWQTPELRNFIGAQMPRMAGFASWIEASGICESPGDFLAIYSQNLTEAMGITLDYSATARALKSLLRNSTQQKARLAGDGIGAGELRNLLDGHRDVFDKRYFPSDGAKLVNELKRLATAFRIEGIDIETGIRGMYANKVRIIVSEEGENYLQSDGGDGGQSINM